MGLDQQCDIEIMLGPDPDGGDAGGEDGDGDGDGNGDGSEDK